MISAVSVSLGSAGPCDDPEPGRTGTCGSPARSSGRSPSQACTPESVTMCSRSAAPTSAGTGTTGTPANRQPVTASTVDAEGLANTATRRAPPRSDATEAAEAINSLLLSTVSSTRTASAISSAVRTSEDSSTRATLPGGRPRESGHIQLNRTSKDSGLARSNVDNRLNGADGQEVYRCMSSDARFAVGAFPATSSGNG